MKNWLLLGVIGCGLIATPTARLAAGPAHPDSSTWANLFAADLADAIKPAGNVWSVTDGVLTASEDKCLWTQKQYENFVLDLEFKTAPGTNSGVIVYASDMDNWIPNSVEIQIADDFAKQWADSPPSWHCAAIFGHLAPTKSAVKKPGEWNRMTVTCQGPRITVALNGEVVTEMDMKQWTSAQKNPDGSDIPAWLSKPKAELATQGHVGLQGKHAGAEQARGEDVVGAHQKVPRMPIDPGPTKSCVRPRATASAAGSVPSPPPSVASASA